MTGTRPAGEQAAGAFPAWLRTQGEEAAGGGASAPRKGNEDRFLDKTILALLGLVSTMRAQDVRREGFRVDAFWQLACTLAIVVLLSLSREFAFVFVVLTCLLLRLCVMPLADLRKVALLAAIAGVFSFVVMAPSALWGNRYSLTMLPAKTVASVLAVGILSRTARWAEIVHALGRVRVPGMLVFIVDIALKYIFLLGEFTLESMRALKLRSVGANRGKCSSIAGIAGNLFIRSRTMAETMYGAMLCRGFSGDYPVTGRVRFAMADMGYIAAHLALAALFFLLRQGT